MSGLTAETEAEFGANKAMMKKLADKKKKLDKEKKEKEDQRKKEEKLEKEKAEKLEQKEA